MEHGCPVNCGKDWSMEQIIIFLEQGPHCSATCKKATRQLRQETEDKIKHKYARVVCWGDIKNNIPKNLKLSPVATIPRKSKPFRCILDLSFTLCHKGIRYSSVNEQTRKLVHPESMAQLGQVVKRIFHTMAMHQHHGHVFKFTKLDVRDSF